MITLSNPYLLKGKVFAHWLLMLRKSSSGLGLVVYFTDMMTVVSLVLEGLRHTSSGTLLPMIGKEPNSGTSA